MASLINAGPSPLHDRDDHAVGGAEPGLTLALDSVRRRGTVVQTGLHTAPARIAMKLDENEIALPGGWCFKITDWPRIIHRVAYPVTKTLTEEVVKSGFDILSSPARTDMKILVRPS
jgi:(R,R)-butanediol dehydrogenase/meso-butanediol dehydrogenase/diacetyl reductase